MPYMLWVKAHYSGKKLLSQILFKKIMCLRTSTKLILKYIFTNNTWNKVVQNPIIIRL
jgi:hypothetical protein